MRKEKEYSVFKALEALSNIGKLSGKTFYSNRKDILNDIISDLPEEKKKRFKKECYENPNVRETILLSRAIIASVLGRDNKCVITDILHKIDFAISTKIDFDSEEASLNAKENLYECIDDFNINVTKEDIAREKNFSKGKTFETTISLIAKTLKKKYFREEDNLAEFV